MNLTLYCLSGNSKILSIDPNALAITILLHLNKTPFKIKTCSRLSDSPSNQLPCMKIDGDDDDDGKFYSGYHEIIRALKEGGIATLHLKNDLESIPLREFLFESNKRLLFEAFNNEMIFKNLVEPALRSAHTNSLRRSLSNHIFPSKLFEAKPEAPIVIDEVKIIQKLKDAFSTKVSENKALLLANLLMRTQLPKEYQFEGIKEYILQFAKDLDCLPFKGAYFDCPDQFLKPEYSCDSQINYEDTSGSMISSGISAYTAVFGVIVAVAVLFSIKNR